MVSCGAEKLLHAAGLEGGHRWNAGYAGLSIALTAALALAASPLVEASEGQSASPGEDRELEVRLVSPRAGDVIAGRTTISAEISAGSAADVASVDFVIDGKPVFSDAVAPYELIWVVGGTERHRITARAYATDGRVAEHTIVVGLPPDVSAVPAYRSRVERVETYVRVEGDGGELALSRDDFELLEDGVPQSIVAVEQVASLPVAIGFLVDCSGSMVERMEFALESAGAFIDGLLEQPQDKAFVMSFADHASVLQEFTNDVSRLSDSLELISSGSYTRLYDAIAAAAEQFEGHEGRRALVVLTDGHDSRSEHDLAETIQAAQRADIALYLIGVDLSPRFHFERWVMRKLADSTGGRFIYMHPRDDADRTFASITDDLRAQYRLTYEPLAVGGDGAWREIEVRAAAESEAGNLKLRSRPGYFAQ